MLRKFNTAIVTIGIDPGKNTLHSVGLDARGAIVLREKVARAKIVSWLAKVPPCLIGIEAGMGTHYARRAPGYFGCGTMRRYGLGARQPAGYFLRASFCRPES